MIKRFLIATIATILLYSCANIVPPTGGPKDLIAPLPIPDKLIPHPSKNTNYQGDYIQITFNEKIALKNPINEITTTPVLDNSKFKTTISKNILKLKFNQDLDSNTTYIINFGKSIVDITEGNVRENIQIAFSTGSLIDSLKLHGTFKTHLTDQPIPNAYIYLYDISDTITPADGRPKYLTKTNTKGQYNFRNLKNGKYEIIGLTEQQQNFVYEPNKEIIGFLPKIIELDTNTNHVDLLGIKESDTLFKINSHNPKANYYQIKANKGIHKDLTIYPDYIIPVYDLDGQTIKLFSNSNDSMLINLSIRDSIDQTIDSTFYITFNHDNKTNLATNISTKLINDSLFLSITTTQPIQSFDTNRITLLNLKDSSMVTTNMLRHSRPTNTSILLYHPSFRTDTLSITIKDSAITTINGIQSIQQQTTYLPHNIENYGTIKGSISTSYKNYTIQLVDNKGVIKYSNTQKGNYTINNVDPGQYFIRVLIDENNDGTFEYGSFKKRILPELIYFHSKPLNIKANWEFLDTNLSF